MQGVYSIIYLFVRTTFVKWQEKMLVWVSQFLLGSLANWYQMTVANLKGDVFVVSTQFSHAEMPSLKTRLELPHSLLL